MQFYADSVLPKWDRTPPCHLRRTRGQERPVTICCVARTSWAPSVFSHLHLPGPTQASLEQRSPRECPHLSPPWILTPPSPQGIPGSPCHTGCLPHNFLFLGPFIPSLVFTPASLPLGNLRPRDRHVLPHQSLRNVRGQMKPLLSHRSHNHEGFPPPKP